MHIFVILSFPKLAVYDLKSTTVMKGRNSFSLSLHSQSAQYSCAKSWDSWTVSERDRMVEII